MITFYLTVIFHHEDGDPHDVFDEPHVGNGDGNSDGGGNGTGKQTAPHDESPWDVVTDDPVKKIRDVDVAVEAEISTIFNIDSLVGTQSQVHEFVEDEDEINYSPNPDTMVLGDDESSPDPVIPTVMALPAKVVSGVKRNKKDMGLRQCLL